MSQRDIEELDIALHGEVTGTPWMALLGEVGGLSMQARGLIIDESWPGFDLDGVLTVLGRAGYRVVKSDDSWEYDEELTASSARSAGKTKEEHDD